MLGTKILGEGCMYASQSLSFKRPIYLGNTVTAIVKVVVIDIEKSHVTFEILCTVEGREVKTGTAKIFIP